jgi:RNA recognition motif-containing protein
MGCIFIFKKKENTMNIYVGNLAINISVDELKTMFAEYGEVESAKIIKDRFSGRSKGFGFVEMPNNSEADQAIKALNRNLLHGQNIKVNPASRGGNRSVRGKKRRRRSF